MMNESSETLEGMATKGLLDDEPAPNTLEVNSRLVLDHEEDSGGGPAE